jgi:flagellar biogenesis protein FliO
MQTDLNRIEKPASLLLSRCWEWMQRALAGVRVRKVPRRLRVCESLALGEKRFVAVIEFETERFLVGGGASSVNLLARLGEALDFAALSTESCERQR